MFAAICPIQINSQSIPENSEAKTNKIKNEIVSRNSKRKTAIKIKMLDGKKYVGKITEVEDETFTITESKTDQIINLAYKDVGKVSSKGLSKGATIGILAGVGAGAAIILGVLAKRVCNEQSC